MYVYSHTPLCIWDTRVQSARHAGTVPGAHPCHARTRAAQAYNRRRCSLRLVGAWQFPGAAVEQRPGFMPEGKWLPFVDENPGRLCTGRHTGAYDFNAEEEWCDTPQRPAGPLLPPPPLPPPRPTLDALVCAGSSTEYDALRASVYNYAPPFDEHRYDPDTYFFHGYVLREAV